MAEAPNLVSVDHVFEAVFLNELKWQFQFVIVYEMSWKISMVSLYTDYAVNHGPISEKHCVFALVQFLGFNCIGAHPHDIKLLYSLEASAHFKWTDAKKLFLNQV